MSHGYRDRPEISIPEDAHINKSDGRLFFLRACWIIQNPHKTHILDNFLKSNIHY